MTDAIDKKIIDFQEKKSKTKTEELRRGGRINVTHKHIEGLVHTEVESQDDAWEEEVKLVSLRDISKDGFQVSTEKLDDVEYVGCVVFSVPNEEGGHTAVDIDARYSWIKEEGEQSLVGFQYERADDEKVQLLIKMALS